MPRRGRGSSGSSWSWAGSPTRRTWPAATSRRAVRGSHRLGPGLRARSRVYASPPGLVLSCVTCVDLGPKTFSHAWAHAEHTLGRWEARVVRRRTGPLGPKPTATTLVRSADTRQPGPRVGPRPVSGRAVRSQAGPSDGAGYDE